MKKTLLSLMALAAILSTQAQSSKTTGIHFIPRVGVNFYNVTGKNFDGEKVNGKLKAGFHVGADVEIPLADEYYLQPGLLFSTKGSKNDSPESKMNISYWKSLLVSCTNQHLEKADFFLEQDLTLESGLMEN
jgi:hypothetical protein